MADISNKAHRDPPSTTPNPVSNLSAREMEIANYYAQGQTSKEIAEKLFISPATVRNHIATIYRKLEIRNKTELVNLMVASNTGSGISAESQAIKTPESELELPTLSEQVQLEPLALPTIAVLPFSNISGDSEQDLFCKGVSEDIITELSRFRDLAVTDRASSFVLGSQETEVSKIKDKLGVQYLVRGSVRRYGARIRLTAQLVDTDSEKEIWAERYDRDIDDIFAVQDALVNTISTTIVGWMERRGRERAKLKPTSSLQAYELVIQGRAHFFRMLREQNIEARDFFEKALSLDQAYSSAHSWLAETHLGDWAGSWTKDPKQSLQTGLDYALKAAWLDNTDSLSHAALGRAYTWMREFDKARFHFDRALELNPNDTWALTSSARCFILEGYPDKGLEHINTAAKLSPLVGLNYQLGIAHYAMRHYREAVQALRTVRDPIDLVYAWLAASFARLDLQGEAETAATDFKKSFDSKNEEVGVSTEQSPVEFLIERFPFRQDRDHAHFVEGLRMAGISH